MTRRKSASIWKKLKENEIQIVNDKSCSLKFGTAVSVRNAAPIRRYPVFYLVQNAHMVTPTYAVPNTSSVRIRTCSMRVRNLTYERQVTSRQMDNGRTNFLRHACPYEFNILDRSMWQAIAASMPGSIWPLSPYRIAPYVAKVRHDVYTHTCRFTWGEWNAHIPGAAGITIASCYPGTHSTHARLLNYARISRGNYFEFIKRSGKPPAALLLKYGCDSACFWFRSLLRISVTQFEKYRSPLYFLFISLLYLTRF